MNSRLSDTMNSRLSDTMNSRLSDRMNSRHNNTIDSRHNNNNKISFSGGGVSLANSMDQSKSPTKADVDYIGTNEH